jgi:hypothetical protein
MAPKIERRTERRTARFLGVVAAVSVKGTPATLTVTISAPLTIENEAALLLLAELKRHDGPVDVTLDQVQMHFGDQ